MPARSRRLALAVPAILAFAIFGGGAPPPADAVRGYAYDTYFGSSYERQIDNRTCVPATTAMMMNILNGRDLNLDQMGILRYAQPRDALSDSVQRGTDPLGWSRAATYYSRFTIRPTTYTWEAYSTEAAALQRAATQITRTGKAVGLLARNGGHAVVMTGFTANHSPLEGSFRVTGVWYSDPLGTRHSYVAAESSPLTKYLQLDATATYDSYWYGKYIVIVPQG